MATHMSAVLKLHIIKSIHTIIWVFFNVVLFYLLYSVLLNRIDHMVWLGIGLILAEGIVLLVFNNKCPLTIIASRYTRSTKDNFDIYLPNWLAKHNKLIYTTLFLLIILILLYQMAKS